MNQSPRLVIAEVVTPEDGETFAEEWYDCAMGSEDMNNAFAATGIVAWPENSQPAQGRFLDIEDEVTERVFKEVQGAVAEAFVRIANEVLTRERGEQAMRQQKPEDAETTPVTPSEPPEYDTMPLDPVAPQIEYQHVPDYYANRDIPHVLARVRAGERFFHTVGEKFSNDIYGAIYAEHIETMERELQPYAFHLALSLIALEDSLGKKA